MQSCAVERLFMRLFQKLVELGHFVRSWRCRRRWVLLWVISTGVMMIISHIHLWLLIMFILRVAAAVASYMVFLLMTRHVEVFRRGEGVHITLLLLLQFGRCSKLCAFLNGDVALILGEILVQGREQLCSLWEVERDFLARVENPHIECCGGFSSCSIGAQPDLPLSGQCRPDLGNESIQLRTVSDSLVWSGVVFAVLLFATAAHDRLITTSMTRNWIKNSILRFCIHKLRWSEPSTGLLQSVDSSDKAILIVVQIHFVTHNFLVSCRLQEYCTADHPLLLLLHSSINHKEEFIEMISSNEYSWINSCRSHLKY